MKLFTYFDNLRKKPEAERRKIVFRISLCITLCIALVWGVTLSFRITHTDFSFAAPHFTEEGPGISETFSEIFGRMKSAFDTTTYENSTSTATDTISQ